MQSSAIPSSKAELIVTWEKLPDDFQLPDEPVDNISQPLLAATLREILELAEFITPAMLIATNFGICATVNDKTVVKAPDWVYVPNVIPVPANQTRRSYTPHLEGDIPAVVMEFLSETEGGEYSMNPNYSYGKWWYYERILQVPVYVIFQPDTGKLDCYQLLGGHYEPQTANSQDRYWIESMGLFLGIWQGAKADRTGYWLRWWDKDSNLLPWGAELVEQERQRAEQTRLELEQERQHAEQTRLELEQERQRLERMTEYLRSQGIDPDSL